MWTPKLKRLLQQSVHLYQQQSWDKIEEVQRAKASPTPPLNMVRVTPKLFGESLSTSLILYSAYISEYISMKKRTGFHTMCWPSCATWACISKQWLLPPYPHHPALPLPACPPMPPLYTHWAPPKQRDENGEGIKKQKSKWICCSVELLSMHVDHNPVGLLVRVIRRRDRESSIKAFSVTVGCTTLLLSGDAPSNPIPTWTNSLFSCLIFQRKVCRQLRLSLLCGFLKSRGSETD